jgi:hypothetical protein
MPTSTRCIATITHITHTAAGLSQGVAVDNSGADIPFVAYTATVGTPDVGDSIILNTTGLALRLGTGGTAFAVAVLTPGGDVRSGDAHSPNDHIVKARYTSDQTAVIPIETHPDYAERVLPGTPVVVCMLHSQLPAVCAAIRMHSPNLRITYIATDGGALHAGFSQTVQKLKALGWITGCITAGQAMGGDFEAVTVASALCGAVSVLKADIVIICQLPGNAGTGTTFGHSGLEQGMWLDIAQRLGGRSIAALRASSADPRPRHQGTSHHSQTILGITAGHGHLVAVPRMDVDHLAGRDQEWTERQLVAPVDTPDIREFCQAAGIALRTMGRSYEEDPLIFQCAAAAGTLASSLLHPASMRSDKETE